MRKRGRVDASQPEVVKRLREAGYSVCVISNIGQGCPDLIVGNNGINTLVELKEDYAAMTDDECNWHREWKGKVEIWRVFNVGGALRVVTDSGIINLPKKVKK